MTEARAETKISEQTGPASGRRRLPLALSLQALRALSYPQYRRFWLGNVATITGRRIFWVTQGWLIFHLTGSPLYLGLVGLATAAPELVLNLVGGVLADKLEQRRLIIVAETFAAVLVALLATLTIVDAVQVWHILAVSFGTGMVQAFNQPARQSLFPHLLDRKDLMSAVSLNSLPWEATRPIIPLLAGFTIALAGAGTAFYLAALGHLLMVAVIMTLKVPPIQRSQGRTVLQDMGEGLRFIWVNSVFALLIGWSFFNSFFGMSFEQLLPAFADSPVRLGSLYAAGGWGALAGIVIAASFGSLLPKSWLLTGGATLFGSALVLFALSQWYIVSLVALFVTGLAYSLYLITTQTTLHMLVPHELRGRVMGIYGLTWTIIPLGGMQAGTVANFLGAPFAVALGGLLVIAYTLGVAANSRIRHLGVALQGR